MITGVSRDEGPTRDADRVLVVDDDAGLARALQRVLLSRGFAVDVAFDGPTAIDRVSTGSYDVMLLDLRMGSMSGLEVFQVVRANPFAPAIIIHSGHLDVPTAVIATRSGACEVLEKPVQDYVLVARIHEAAAARRSRLAVPESGDSGSRPSLPDLQREVILRAYAGSGRNLSRAARELGIPRSTLRDRLRRYGAH